MNKKELAAELLLKGGFDQIGAYEFRNNDYFNVFLGQVFVIFSTRKFTSPVLYEKLERKLLQEGYLNTKGQA